MDRLNCCLGSNSRRYEFPSSREASHQVLLDKPQRYAKVGSDEILVNEHWSSATRGSEIAVPGVSACIIADDPVGICDFRSNDLVDFQLGGDAMEAGGNKNGNSAALDPCAMKPLEERGKSDAVGRRASNVADNDCDFPLSFCQETIGSQPSGWPSAWLNADVTSGTGATPLLSTIVELNSSGSETSRPVLPKANLVFICEFPMRPCAAVVHPIRRFQAG